MKKSAKKLRLNRETLLSLNDPNLRDAAGGVTAGPVCASKDPTVCGTNCPVCGLTDTCTHCSNLCM